MGVRTNAIAGGGGGIKYLEGSFTATATSTQTSQNSFTVSGLDFEPRIIIIRCIGFHDGEAYGTYSGYFSHAFTDFETGIGFFTTGSHPTTDGRVTSRSGISVSGSGGTYTFTTAEIMSYYKSISKVDYGSYAYYIYG